MSRRSGPQEEEKYAKGHGRTTGGPAFTAEGGYAQGSGSKWEHSDLKGVGDAIGDNIDDGFSSAESSPISIASSASSDDDNEDNADKSLGITAEEIFERAKLGPAALLKFLNWEGREKTRWTMTILVGELRQALHPDAKLIFQPAPGKKSSPGTPWLRVRKSLQPEVDRMLGLVYSAVRVAREEERAREAARGEGPPKAKDEEEEEEEEEGGSGKSTDSGYRSKRDEVKMVGKLKGYPLKKKRLYDAMARKVSLECLLPTVLLPASDQDIEADLAELKAGVEALEKAVKADDDMMEPPKAGEADKADTDMMEMAAVSPKKHVVKKSSSSSGGSGGGGANKENVFKGRRAGRAGKGKADANALEPQNGNNGKRMKVLFPENSGLEEGRNCRQKLVVLKNKADKPLIKCEHAGCKYSTYRLDNYQQFHLPQHTGVYKYKCEAGNGCVYRSTRADRLRKHKAGGKKTCPKLA